VAAKAPGGTAIFGLTGKGLGAFARGLGRPRANEHASEPREERLLEQTGAFRSRGLGRPRANEHASEPREERQLEQTGAFRSPAVIRAKDTTWWAPPIDRAGSMLARCG
jgi:hypothetical protein